MIYYFAQENIFAVDKDR